MRIWDSPPASTSRPGFVFKPDAASLLRAELGKPGYACAPIALGTNTDPYQPVERDLGITRAVLEVLAECGHPVMIVTKSARVERDLDVLGPMARTNRCSVSVSITTLDRSLARRMEPRASAPHRRLETVRRLSEAGIPTGVFASPMIPFVNDAELEAILERAHEAGALGVSYTMLRLPLEIADLFREWLAEHYPDRAERVMERVRDTRGGKDYDSTFGQRMRGTGPGGGAAREALPARGEAPGVSRLPRPRLLGVRPAPARARAAPAVVTRQGARAPCDGNPVNEAREGRTRTHRSAGPWRFDHLDRPWPGVGRRLSDPSCRDTVSGLGKCGDRRRIGEKNVAGNVFCGGFMG